MAESESEDEELVIEADDQTAGAFRSIMKRMTDFKSNVLGSFKGLNQKLDTAQYKLNKIASSFDFTGVFSDSALELGDITAKLSAQMGQTDEYTNNLQNSIFELSALTGRSTSVFAQLSHALGMTGRGLNDLSSARNVYKDGNLVDVVWGEKEALAALIDAFDISADEAVELNKAADYLGASFHNMLNLGADMQRKFKVAGILNQVPQAAQNAAQSISEFGRGVTGDADKVIRNTISLGAVFTKTFGRSMKESVQEATNALNQMYTETEGIQRVMLGLDSSFSPMVNTLLEAGVSIDEVNEMIRKGGDKEGGVIDFASRIVEIQKQLQDTRGAAAADRFFLQMKSVAKGQLRDLITMPESLKAAREEMERVNKLNKSAGIRSFQNMAEKMWSTGKVAIDVFKNLVSLSKTITGLVFEPLARGIFERSGADLSAFNQRLNEIRQSLNDKNGVFQTKIIPTLSKFGGILATVGSVAGLATSGLAVFKVGGPIISGLKMIGRFVPGLTSVGGLLGTIGKLFSRASVFAAPLLAIRGIYVALNEMGDSLANAEGFSGKVRAILSSVAKGAGDVLNIALLGIPERVMNHFLPNFKGSFSEAVKVSAIAAFDYVGSSEFAALVGGYIKMAYGSIAGYLGSVDWGSVLYETTRGVVSGLVAFNKFVLFDVPKKAVDMLATYGTKLVVGAFNTIREQGVSGLMSALWSGLQGLGNILGNIASGVIDGILSGLGVNVDVFKIELASLPGFLYDKVQIGILDTTSFVIKQIDRMVNAATQSSRSLLKLLGDALASVGATDVAAGFKKAESSLSNVLSSSTGISELIAERKKTAEESIQNRTREVAALIAEKKAAQDTAKANRMAQASFKSLFNAASAVENVTNLDAADFMNQAKSMLNAQIAHERKRLSSSGLSNNEINARMNSFISSKSSQFQAMQNAVSSGNSANIARSFNSLQAPVMPASPTNDAKQTMAPSPNFNLDLSGVPGAQQQEVLIRVEADTARMLKVMAQQKRRAAPYGSGLGGF